MRTGFIYTDAYFDYDYGPTHPLKIFRLQLAYDLIEAYGLLQLPSVELIPTQKATDEDLALFNGRDYLGVLKAASEGRLERSAYQYGLGPGDNPVFRGLYDWSLWVTGATLQAGDLVADRCQRTVLDFDQLVAADDVDAEAGDRGLQLGRSVRVDFFQLAMECGFQSSWLPFLSK